MRIPPFATATAVLLTSVLAGCANGPIFEGPPPIPPEQVVEMAKRGDNAGTIIGEIQKSRTVNADAELIVSRVRELYFGAKVFEKADKLVDKFRAKAESLADAVEPTEFRELLYYLVDTVLEKGELPRQGITQFVELGL